MSYLIKDTTRAERKKHVENALAISLLDAGEPTEKTMLLVDQYINGERELDDVKQEILKMYMEEEKN